MGAARSATLRSRNTPQSAARRATGHAEHTQRYILLGCARRSAPVPPGSVRTVGGLRACASDPSRDRRVAAADLSCRLFSVFIVLFGGLGRLWVLNASCCSVITCINAHAHTRYCGSDGPRMNSIRLFTWLLPPFPWRRGPAVTRGCRWELYVRRGSAPCCRPARYGLFSRNMQLAVRLRLAPRTRSLELSSEAQQ